MRLSVIVIALSVLLSPLLLNSAKAQLRLEPTFSFEIGHPLSLERTPGIINRFGTPGTGKSHNFMLGIGGTLVIPFSDQFSFSPTLQYRYSFGGFTSDPYSAIVTDSVGSISTKNYFDVTTTEHRLDILTPVVFSLGKLSFDLGFWSGFDLSRSIEGKEYINSPDTAYFPDHSRARTFASGDTIGASHTHYGIELGVATKFAASASLALEEKLYTRVDLAAASDVPSKAFSLGLSFSLTPYVRPVFTALPDEIDTIYSRTSAPNKITTSIHFTKNGARVTKQTPVEVTGYNTFYRQYTELPTTVTYSDATGLSQYDLLSSSETKQFSPSDLSRKDGSDYVHELLNIIGYRLASTPDAVLDLSCSYSGQNESTASNKIRLLENYFIDRWGIAAGQIHSKVHKGEEELISVASSDQRLLAPAATQWIERSYNIPHMGIEKSIIADAGVNNWRVTITQNEKTIANFSNRSTSESNIADFDLLSDTASASPLIATIEAADFSGATSISRDTLILPNQEQLGKTMLEREAIVIVFLPHSSAMQDDMTAVLLKKIFAVTKPTAKITISEPADILGTVNKKTIAEEIVSGLKLHPEIRAEIKILKRQETTNNNSTYRSATIVKIEQEK